MPSSRHGARLANALRRLRRGLPARDAGARVSPEAANDLFQAHLAAYHCAGRLAAGQRVLDLGCGTGYGSAHLLAAGAAAVVGLDPDAAAIAYARRRFAGPRLGFVAGRGEDLPDNLAHTAAAPGAAFDLVVAANLLAHLAAPEVALAAARRALAATGALVASVPPIVDERTMEQHRAAAAHRANRYLWDWETLLRNHFQELRLFRLLPPRGVSLDLADPRPSRHAAAAFRCDEVALSDPAAAGTLAAIFVCTRPAPVVF